MPAYPIPTKKAREQIFQLFLEHTELRFSEIEKKVHVRSNILSYYLEKMQKEDLIQKKGENYSLTTNAEKSIPFFRSSEKIGPLVVVLVAVVYKDTVLMLKRTQKPYLGYWGLVGGRMLLGEDFAQSSIRLVKEKTGLETTFLSLNCTFHERVEEKGLAKFGFIHFFTKVELKEHTIPGKASAHLCWIPLKNSSKEKIIPSDLWLIQSKMHSKMNIPLVTMSEKSTKIQFKVIE